MATVTRVIGHKRHPLRNSLIAGAVILVLLVGGGIGYVYFQAEAAPETKAAADTASDPIVKAVKPAANAPASAAMQVLTPTVAPGDNAAININTVAGSNCKVVVTYNGVAARDSGLVAKDADQFGVVNWTWTIAQATPTGNWPIDVTCVYNGRSAVVSGKIQVSSRPV